AKVHGIRVRLVQLVGSRDRKMWPAHSFFFLSPRIVLMRLWAVILFAPLPATAQGATPNPSEAPPKGPRVFVVEDPENLQSQIVIGQTVIGLTPRRVRLPEGAYYLEFRDLTKDPLGHNIKISKDEETIVVLYDNDCSIQPDPEHSPYASKPQS